MKTFKKIMFALIAAFTLSFVMPQNASAFNPQGTVTVGNWIAGWTQDAHTIYIQLINMVTGEKYTYIYLDGKQMWPVSVYLKSPNKGKLKVYLGDKEVKAGGGGVSWTVDEILSLVVQEIENSPQKTDRFGITEDPSFLEDNIW